MTMRAGITAVLLATMLHGCTGAPVADVASSGTGESSRTVAMQCGTLPIMFRQGGERVELETPDRLYALEQTGSAAAGRYQAVEDPDTAFRTSGERAQLILAGESLPECLAPGQVAQPFTARGNEPFWRIDLDGDTFTLDRLGHEALTGSIGWDDKADEVSRGSVTLAGERLALTVHHEVCQDSMTGMPYPRTVTFVWREMEYSGCGGDPARLLRGSTWVVEDVAGQDELSVPPTLTFLADGRAAGRATCNRYRAAYELTGEGLVIDRPAVTRMACAAEMMAQEDRFLDQLAAVGRFRVAEDGSLELVGAGETLLRLRRQ